MRKIIPAIALLLLGCSETQNQIGGAAESGKTAGLLRLARGAEMAGDSASSISILRQGMVSDPKNTEVYLKLAELYNKQNQPEEAAKILEQGLDVNQSNAELGRRLGNIYLQLEQPEKALVKLEEVISTNPKDARLHSSKGVALDMLQKQDEARGSYTEALNLDSSNVSALNNLAMSYILSGDLKQATATLEKAVKQKQPPQQARMNLSFVYALQGEYDKARRLGLKDLSEREMRENLEFYRKISSFFIAGNESSEGSVDDDLKSHTSARVEPVKAEDKIGNSPGMGTNYRLPLPFTGGARGGHLASYCSTNTCPPLIPPVNGRETSNEHLRQQNTWAVTNIVTTELSKKHDDEPAKKVAKTNLKQNNNLAVTATDPSSQNPLLAFKNAFTSSGKAEDYAWLSPASGGTKLNSNSKISDNKAADIETTTVRDNSIYLKLGEYASDAALKRLEAIKRYEPVRYYNVQTHSSQSQGKSSLIVGPFISEMQAEKLKSRMIKDGYKPQVIGGL